MDRYQRVEKPRPESTINENEIRITAQGLIRNYINYANALLQEKRVGEIVLKAMGHAINKTVAVAEIVKKRIPGLHQDTSISSIRITDVWEPIEEGLLPLETTRHVSMISITLSIKELNPNSPGYQAAVFGEQPKQLTRTQPPQIQKPQQQHQQYQPQFQQQQPRHNQYHQQPRQQQQQPPRQHQYQPPQQYQSYQQHRNTSAPNAGVNEDSYLRGRGRGRGRSWGGRGYNGYNTNTYNNNQENGDYNYYGNRGGRGRGWGNRGGSGYERGRGNGRGGGYYSRGRGRMGGGGGNGGHHS